PRLRARLRLRHPVADAAGAQHGDTRRDAVALRGRRTDARIRRLAERARYDRALRDSACRCGGHAHRPFDGLPRQPLDPRRRGRERAPRGAGHGRGGADARRRRPAGGLSASTAGDGGAPDHRRRHAAVLARLLLRLRAGEKGMTARAAPHLAHRAKRRRDVVTPEGIALPFTVASRGARAGALLLDLTLMFVTSIVVTLALIWIAGGLFDAIGGTGETSGAVEFIAVFWTLFWFLLWNGYFMIMEMGPRGATFGKRATGIRVASREGGRLTPEAVVARNLLRDIELFLPIVFLMSAPSGETGAAGIAAAAWFLVFLLFPFFNRDALRAGDLIAGTWVVEAPRAALAETLSTEGAAREGASALTGAEYRFGEAEL